jgi:hypothetical protein
MWVCPSSGSRPRYLDDVVRALALRPGAELTFRYDKRHVASDILKQSTFGGEPQALLGFHRFPCGPSWTHCATPGWRFQWTAALLMLLAGLAAGLASTLLLPRGVYIGAGGTVSNRPVAEAWDGLTRGLKWHGAQAAT